MSITPDQVIRFDAKFQAQPHIGDIVNVRGMRAKIIAIRPLGTIDVETETGRFYRISGLALDS